MAKKHIEGETKAERKARKALIRAEKQKDSKVSDQPIQPIITTKKDCYVVCLKFGNKYDSTYVNRLYNMVKRNLTIDYEFVCFTENPEGIDPEIKIQDLPVTPAVTGWWYKPFFFNPKLPIQGTILYLDLDVVVFNNIDHLFTWREGEFCIIRDFNRMVVKNYQKFNSSVFRLDVGQHAEVYKKFILDPRTNSRRFHGDQDWIRYIIREDFHYWPEEWIQSYKWEMRGKPRMDSKPRGYRDFQINGDPKIHPDTSIAVFHGDPNPHNCKDKWVIDNWQ